MQQDKRIKVCMISCRHELFDDRIYKKEAVTLAKNGYELIHIAYGDEERNFYSIDGVRLIQRKYLKRGATLKSNLLSLRQTAMEELFLTAKEQKAAVYHLHDVELCRIAPKLKDLPWKPKVIYDAHEPYWENLLAYWSRRSLSQLVFIDLPALFAEKRLLKKADALIATEKNVASRFEKKNPNSFIIYNYSYFDPKKHRKEEEKLYDIVYCGGMTESKGVFLMLKALARAKKEGYEFKLALVGDSEKNMFTKLKMNEIIRKENLSDNVFFIGQLPLEYVTDYYNQSKIGVCILPFNLATRLILPIKLFEYMSFGLPIVGSNFGHMKRIIKSEGVGLTVNPHNAKAVAAAFIKLLKDDDYKKYVPVCVHAVENKYLWKNQEESLLRIYEKILPCGDFQNE